MLAKRERREVYNQCIQRLQECANARALGDGKRAHELIQQSGWIHDRLLGNLLIRMYGICGCLTDAIAAFDAIRERNVYSWNLIVAANAQNGQLHHAAALFDRMPQRDLFAWNAMIGIFCQASHLEEAKSVFDRMPEREALSWNSILAAFSQNSHAHHALEIFRRMPARDLSSWNSMIQIHAQLDQTDALPGLFDAMPERDVISWTTIVAAFARKGQMERAGEIFRLMPQTNTRGWNVILVGSSRGARSIFDTMPERDLVSWNEFIAASAKIGDLDAASTIFQLMPRRDVISWTTMLHGVMSYGRLEHAKRLFDEIPARNVVTWTVAITSYGDGGDVDSAREAFARMPQHNLFTWNAMMSALSDQGNAIHLQDAREIFDALPYRDAISWNTLISGYAQQGQIRDAFDLFAHMPGRDNVSWNAILLAYTEESLLQNAIALFDRMPCRDLIAWNTMIRAYALDGHIDEARQAFDGADEKDGVAWTAMIRGYNHNGCSGEAIRLFMAMDLEGIKPSGGLCFVAALNSCSAPRFLEQGRRLCERILALGLESDQLVAAGLISMLGKCGDLQKAARFYREELSEDRRIAVAGAMISALAANSQVGAARELFDRLPEPTKDWNAMIQAHVAAGEIDRAEELFQEIPAPDIVAWSTMIAGYARSGRGEEALQRFRSMDLEGVRADARSFVAAVEASAITADSSRLETIHALAVECGLDSHTIVGTSIVDALCKRGSLAHAWIAFAKISSRPRIPWSAMVGGLARNGYSRESVALFREMLAYGAAPDAVTFVSVLAACSHGGMLRDGVGYFVAMPLDFGVSPTVDHYRCVVDLLGRAGLLGEAEEFLEEAMPVLGREDSVAWTSLLGSCWSHGEVERGKRLGELAVGFNWEEQSSSPFVLLSHLSCSD
ncbi:pentatricopeptide repeat-containing protein At1g32415, mitochondrial [Selaginella moellendorffii]|uniref:pentatricopeptide repeat-containing protein At1g32415, mitochondrial n=1 Tax=Selaginella moellendorffii TaxID=88036 RepID=UPI000D1CDA4C|nr:pentatricopeptide repeat-containing protein At1g32415, mitochondrial [Selaginella moellendorffii]|eukprot:XP_024534876.1 pentatricopeptide repeat-containing protein At1g32415, mitochondrial [Selaginella moellendorffii]